MPAQGVGTAAISMIIIKPELLSLATQEGEARYEQTACDPVILCMVLRGLVTLVVWVSEQISRHLFH